MGNLGLSTLTDWHTIIETMVLLSNKRYGLVDYRRGPTKKVGLQRVPRTTRV